MNTSMNVPIVMKSGRVKHTIVSIHLSGNVLTVSIS